ncbi:MAG: 3'(2'),5'-bisphosphate nucleotidase CysQ [Pseudomonadales bacterium]
MQLRRVMDDVTIAEVIQLTQAAGDEILEVYNSDFDVQTKADTSPLTQADLAAHAVIVAGLKVLTPDVPVLSEESEAPPFEIRKNWQRYWLVDPLDGTKEFVNRNGEFTVNIALIEQGQPTFGVVAVPVQDCVYVGDVPRLNAYCIEGRGGANKQRPLHGRPMAEQQGITIVASRSHGGERLEKFVASVETQFAPLQRTPVGSSLKLCILAEGQADFYPRLGPTSEWDIGAAHAVLAAAGGEVWAADGQPLTYNAKESLLNPEFFAVADAGYPWRTQLPEVPPLGD